MGSPTIITDLHLREICSPGEYSCLEGYTPFHCILPRLPPLPEPCPLLDPTKTSPNIFPTRPGNPSVSTDGLRSQTHNYQVENCDVNTLCSCIVLCELRFILSSSRISPCTVEWKWTGSGLLNVSQCRHALLDGRVR